MQVLLRSRAVLSRIARKTHYKTLGIDVNSDKKEIKSAYLAKAREFHPDKNQGDPNAGDRFRKIQEAYETLSDVDLKSEYDRTVIRPKTSDSNAANASAFETGDSWSAFDDIYYNGFTRRDRSSFEGPFDPWSHSFRNNQAKRMWEYAMEMEHGDANYYQEPFREDLDDEAMFEEVKKAYFESFTVNGKPRFRDDYYDFYHEANCEFDNPNHQRFHYKDYSHWNRQKSTYENKFNKKYGFAGRRKKDFGKARKNERSHADMWQEQHRYWEEPVSDQYSTFARERTEFYEDENMHDWGQWIDRFPSHWDPWDYEPRPKSPHSREKSANRKRNQEKYEKDRKRESDSKGKERKEAKQQKQGKKQASKNESTRNAQRVHAQLNEFGEAKIEMDGVTFILEVQQDGSLSMSRESGKKTKKSGKKSASKKRD